MKVRPTGLSPSESGPAIPVTPSPTSAPHTSRPPAPRARRGGGGLGSPRHNNPHREHLAARWALAKGRGENARPLARATAPRAGAPPPPPATPPPAPRRRRGLLPQHRQHRQYQ